MTNPTNETRRPFVINVPKTGQTFTFAFDELSAPVQNFIIDYGFTQKLSDFIASIKVEDIAASEQIAQEAFDRVQDLVDGLHNGIVPSGGGRTTDPVMQRAKEIAGKRIKAAIKKTGGKAADYFKAASLAERVAALLEAQPAIVDTARAQIESERDLNVDVDLDVIGDMATPDDADDADADESAE
tara:strand:+ start:347 stop:901 length:555 start_codon:yes stop_codon:yes gene_type:complete